MNDKICSKCNEIIYEDDKYNKYCCLNTYLNNNLEEEKWFHLRCYIEWFNENVEKKAMSAFNSSMSYAINNLKGLGVLQDVNGGR